MKDIPLSPRIIEIKRNRRKKRVRIFLLLVVLLASIIFALSFFSSNKKITINNINVSGNHIVSTESITENVLKNISGKYVYLFSKSNSFIYPQNEIYNDLLLNFPRIEKLSVNLDGLNTLHIDIIERVGSYLYCGGVVPIDKNEVGENCYFINDDGFIFDKAPYFSGNIYFKYYVDIKDDNPLGKQVLPKDYFHRLMRFIENTRNTGLDPVYVVIQEDGVNHLYLNHKEGNTKPELIFKKDADLDTLFENLSLAMNKKEFKNEIDSKYDSLLYIDLRFKNKVLYKFQ